MRVELGFFEDYEGCEIGPDTILRDVRPYGRRVTWKEEGSPTIWHTFIPEDEYDEDTYDVEKLTGVALPEEFYRLPYDPAWTEFKGPLHSNQFLKAVKVRDYDPYETKPTWPVNEVSPFKSHSRVNALPCAVELSSPELRYSTHVMSLQHKEEIMIYEELKSHPHPSIVRYHGVLVEDGFVTGIVLDKLDEDVYGAVGQPAKKSHIWTVDKVIKDIKEGLDHLHSLGIMHASPWYAQRGSYR